MRSDIKYQPGKGPRRTSAGRPIKTIEIVTLAHLAIFLVFSTWWFGGASHNARLAMSWWGTVGAGIMTVAIGDKTLRKDLNLSILKWLWPLLAFNTLILVSCLNLNLRPLDFGNDVGYIKVEGISKFVPSTGLISDSLRGLWLFDAIYLSAFSVFLMIQQRRLIRLLLGIACINAVVLTIFGTLQKLGHAKGLFFNLVPSPQPYFFASFVYDNHWGAYAVLSAAILLGLVVRTLRRQSGRDFLHSPAPMGLICVLLIAIGIPFSGSRACTVLIVALLGQGGASFMAATIRRRRASRESALVPIGAGILGLTIAVAAVWFVAGATIRARLDKTSEQLSTMRTAGGIGSRAILYHDTARMGHDLPVFGWGMGTYSHIFLLYNTQVSRADDLPVFYNDAHSDPLQSYAEHGIVGTLLLVLCFAVPLFRIRRARAPGPIPTYLFWGCGLILAYSFVEFPFGNPAVAITWCVCLFSAIRYTLLESTSATKPS